MNNQENTNSQNDISAPPEPDIKIRTMQSDINLAEKGDYGNAVEVSALTDNYQYGFPQEQQEYQKQQISSIQDKPTAVSSGSPSIFKIILIILTMITISAVSGLITYYLSSKLF